MRAKIPATVVTGFLGAGKTTLIRHLVAESGRRLALLVNEFGEVGIDRELILGCGVEGCREEDVIELANGCICCTVADDFVPAMRKILARDPRPDHILVETSGLALPKPLVKAFAWPEIRSAVTVDGVIAVVDAEAVAEGRMAPELRAGGGETSGPPVDHGSPLEEVFEEQLGSADLVVMTKVDLVDGPALARAERLTARYLRPAARLVRARVGAIDPDVVLGLGAGAEDDLASRPSPHEAEGEHEHGDFESFVVSVAPAASAEARRARVTGVAAEHPVIRIKGFAAVEGRAARYVLQAVGPRAEGYFDRPWAPGEERSGRLVVIGMAGLDRVAIEAALAA